GKMGEPSAKSPLKNLQSTDYDPVVQLQVVEALARLGDEHSIALLEAFTKSQYMEDRTIAVQSLGRLANARSAFILRLLMNDKKQEPSVRVAAAGSLARLGEQVKSSLPLKAAIDPEGVIRKFRGKGARILSKEIADLRVIAILSLGYVPEPLAADTLAPFLRSPEGAVRVAAGKTLLHLLQAYKPSVDPLNRLEKTTKPDKDKDKDDNRPDKPRLHTSGGRD
ncbi:MAG: HEAT repeat domain-containing protein, partial [Phycisphaerae bacterium]|nr:HEAT repeat domain-containing protein [Phycisphaerae bacterium]